jgi:hypothetical protein
LKEIRDKLKNVQKQLEELLLHECHATPTLAVEELKQLIQKEANIKSLIADTRFDNCLQLAASHGKIELVQFLLDEGFEDKPGTIATSNHIYDTDCLKVKRRYNLHG